MRSVLGDAQESITDASGSTHKSITPAHGDTIPYQSHAGAQFFGALPGRKHDFHDENVMGLLGTEGGYEAFLPMEPPPSEVGLQRPDKGKRAMTLESG